MERATALCYPLRYLPGIKFPLAALPHPSGNFSVSASRAEQPSMPALCHASFQARYPAQLGRSNCTDVIPDLHLEFGPRVYPTALKKKIKKIPAAFALVTIGDNKWVSRSYSSLSLPSLTAFLLQLRGRAETSHGGTELCHALRLCIRK